MTIIDSNSLEDGAELRADVCIVGAGAAGITIALQLAASGRSVCLLESGNEHHSDDVQALYDLDNQGYPIRENFMARVRAFGGSCNLWAGRAMKLSPIDFEERDWVPHSGWPIRFEDLSRYYPLAERVLRVPSFSRFERVADLRDADPKERSLFDGDEFSPSVALWGAKPMRFGKIYRRQLRNSRDISVYLNANVTEIVPTEGGDAIAGLEVRTLAGRRFRAKADQYVLACGGLENARLLLVSRRRHAHGIGNENDLVGRYYLDHPRTLLGSVRLNLPARLPYLMGLPLADGKVQLGIALSERAQREDRVLNSYLSVEPQLSDFAAQQYGRTVNALKTVLKRGHSGSRIRFNPTNIADVREMIYLLTPKELMPHFLYRYYAWLKRAMRRTLSVSHLTVINFCEQVPDPDSRVTLGTERDALDMHKLVLRWRVGTAEVASIERLHARLARRLNAVGIGTLEQGMTLDSAPRFTDASHHLGTARMSDSPHTGVVDRNCRVHGMENLYIAGSAVFPTAGHANPTLTIVALAIRLADHLKQLCS
ncbi:MAG: GMC family oxidoreductase [Gammaproteobacteria bacterium]